MLRLLCAPAPELLGGYAMSYFLLFLAVALLAAPLWALPAIVVCIIIWRRLAAFILRGAGRAHSPLPTFMGELEALENNWELFWDSAKGRALITVISIVLIVTRILTFSRTSNEKTQLACAASYRCLQRRRYSYSQTRSGICSHHGGVAQWLAR